MTDIPFFAEKSPSKGEKLTFVLIFIPSFALLLTLAVLGQLIGLKWKSWLPGAENMSNVFSGVKAAVYTFMSHII
jgi:light-harvesting complex 1 beta chain